MLTDRGKLLLVAAPTTWVVGRLLAIPQLWMAAVATVALLALAVGYARVASAQLALRRAVHPQRLFHDADGEVVLDLRNDGRLPTAALVVEDLAPAVLADPPRFVLDPLPSGATRQLVYPLRGRQRGRYTIGPALVNLRDPFGVAQRPVRFGGTVEVVVYPPVWALPDVLPPLGRQGTSYDGAPRPVATSGEFANVREYVRGDDLRKVHWRCTAHRGKLMIKQEESPQDVEATLLLDVRRDAHRGVGPGSTFEQAVETVASAAYHLSERRYALRLVTGASTAPLPTTSWRHILEVLAVIGVERGASLRPVWQQLASGLGGNGLLLTVVTPPSPEDLREMVRAGRSFAARVAVVVAPGGHSGRDRGLLSTERTLLALRGAGWRVTVHRPGQALDAAWRELALRPAGVTPAGVGR
ncbi:MAG TPA: DUF58 domain-containing protein [Nitriliruptorales bacterium]|nr:DUF58 domain-containing protein [Nitriliruptorales bacterium]